MSHDLREVPKTLGYARDRNVAISPVNPRPFKTLFHELAHVLLGQGISPSRWWAKWWAHAASTGE